MGGEPFVLKPGPAPVPASHLPRGRFCPRAPHGPSLNLSPWGHHHAIRAGLSRPAGHNCEVSVHSRISGRPTLSWSRRSTCHPGVQVTPKGVTGPGKVGSWGRTRLQSGLWRAPPESNVPPPTRCHGERGLRLMYPHSPTSVQRTPPARQTPCSQPPGNRLCPWRRKPLATGGQGPRHFASGGRYGLEAAWAKDPSPRLPRGGRPMVWALNC